MDVDLHKRLEKEKHEYAYMLTPMFSLNYSEEYGRAATAFMRGTELGYKEAVKVAKEWLDKEWDEALFNLSLEECLKKFEADMNKLLEEKEQC